MKKYQSSLVIAMMLVNASLCAETVSFSENLTIKPTLELTTGMFYSQKSYRPDMTGSVSWQEMVAKYGVDAEYQFGQSTVYAALKGVSSATVGDGDAAQLTTGDERKTSLEEWKLGWRNGTAEDAYLHLNLGRQNIQIADGFMVAGDALNLGNGVAAGELNRGGGYYLAARRSFDFAASADYRFNDQIRSHWYYLDSDNKAQYQPTLWATDWTYQFSEQNHLGLTYLKVTDVEDPWLESVRDDLQNIALRGQMQVTPQLQVKAEYVHQDQKTNNERAWYTALNYQLDQVSFQPMFGYRYSEFSAHYDPLFYGNTEAGFGTWFQGEVAGNYAGPYSSNARIHQVSLQTSVQDNLHLGVLAYQFATIDHALGENLDATEVDLFAVWSPTKNLNIIPLVGFYNPKKDINSGGSQMNGAGTNTYAQLILNYTY